LEIDMPSKQNTRLTIRVQALGGKFLGDDIGGALIAVRDAQTGELLSHGPTAGDSGGLTASYATNASLATIVTPAVAPASPTVRWLLALPTTSSFFAQFETDRPRLLEIEAVGPRGGLQSAHRVVATEWVTPGQDLTAAPGLVVLIPGLLVQVMSPAIHTEFAASAPEVNFAVHVAMMCGCPISNALDNPWLPSDFEVTVQVNRLGGPYSKTWNLDFNAANTPGLFTQKIQLPTPVNLDLLYYEAVVTARQKSTGNVGTATVTLFG
jgi:hypothetical protein